MNFKQFEQEYELLKFESYCLEGNFNMAYDYIESQEEEINVLTDFIQLQKDTMFPDCNLVAIKQIIHFLDFCIQNTYIGDNSKLLFEQARVMIDSLDDYDVDELSNSEIIDCLIELRNFMIANDMLGENFNIITWDYILHQWDTFEQEPFKICPTVDPIDLGQGIDW